MTDFLPLLIPAILIAIVWMAIKWANASYFAEAYSDRGGNPFPSAAAGKRPNEAQQWLDNAIAEGEGRKIARQYSGVVMRQGADGRNVIVERL